MLINLGRLLMLFVWAFLIVYGKPPARLGVPESFQL
ncbi:DUF1145 domain-containing protein [Salmonella enterica]